MEFQPEEELSPSRRGTRPSQSSPTPARARQVRNFFSPKIILTGCKESLIRKLRKLTSLDSCQVVGDFEIEWIVWTWQQQRDNNNVTTTMWQRDNNNVTTTTWQQQRDNVTTNCVIILLDSSPQRPYSLRILPWCLHSSRCLRPRSQIVLLKANNPPLLHRKNIQSDTDVTRSASQSGCTVLTLMGIALEKQESEKSESFQERESDADDKRCFTSVACDTFKYQSMLGLLLRHSVLDKKLINTRPTNHYVSFHRCTWKKYVFL